MPELVMPSARAQAFWNLKTRLVRWRADLVATVSNASANAIARALHIPRGRIAVLTEGTSAEFSPNARPDDERRVVAAAGARERYILYVGGLSPHKRVPDLIRAFGAVAVDPQFADVALVLAGPDARDTFAADRSGVARALADIAASRSRVVQTGFVDDATLAALYRGATCVVLPSRAEGFGLPALEAMASGTPLIAARNPALEETCADAAEYVDDAGGLQDALARLLTSAERRAALRRAGLERATHCGWDAAAARLLAALEPARVRRSPNVA
jgi:glycosyltransferase involved in cell wall biosynthesis